MLYSQKNQILILKIFKKIAMGKIKNDYSNYLPDHIYIYDPLDDPLSQTLGKLSVFHDQKLLTGKCYLFKWISDYFWIYFNDLR